MDGSPATIIPHHKRAFPLLTSHLKHDSNLNLHSHLKHDGSLQQACLLRTRGGDVREDKEGFASDHAPSLGPGGGGSIVLII